MKKLALALVALAALPAWGQAPPSKQKIAVNFSCNCTDSTGAAFATAFRDLLANSPRYREAAASSEKTADGKEIYNWKIAAVSIDPTDSDTGTSTVMSVVFLLGDNYFLASRVQTCGRVRVDQCAADVLAGFDELLNK